MKRSHVFVLFYIGTPFLLLARCLQRFYMIDSQTGFFADGFAEPGSVVTAAFAVFALAMFLLFRFDRTCTVAIPQKSIALAVGALFAAAFLAVSAVYQLLTEDSTAALLTALLGALFAACLVWRGLSRLGVLREPVWMAPVGTFYALVRLIVRFASYAGEVTVSDSLFDILTMCLLLLFFFSEGKALAGLDTKRLPALYGASALGGALFCLSEFAPTVIDRLMGNEFALHGAGIPDPAYFGFAVYLLIAAHVAVRRTHSA